ncbi:cupin domain-containing protein [Kordiimonas sp. SCSIO 12610]|uniref:cupin domain-containing protein n=1 Tax=Kordiimonas sp. SCSIO 12610 TaxID=2829597 RepID=UPI00210BBAC2|nr:cupin domain-containing protein [Kordiimonas sp. SCSIO 12610]UTW54800.1 cupin domain-containing protein [Kordiimonas sp. SCSIO 12610]
MKINADFDQRVVVHSEQEEWIKSPMPGVYRRPLDRVGDEVARATSIVKYAPGSKFSPHVHTGGEEFIVLDGVFQDEHGDFPVGSYIRNPPQSKHTPGAEEGCVIFVKLWQFDPIDRTHVRLNVNYMEPVPHRDHEGVSITLLYIDDHERVELQIWEPNTIVEFDAPRGAEFLVLDGNFSEGDDKLVKHSWMRVPEGARVKAYTDFEGAKVWIKHGNLQNIVDQIDRVQKS